MLGLLARAGTALAKTGIIRGTVGRILGGAKKHGPAIAATAATAAGVTGMGAVRWPTDLQVPVFNPGGVNQAGAGTAIVKRGAAPIVRAAGGAITKRWSKKAMQLLAGGILFEAGGKLYNAITGEPYRERRKMNYANGAALKRAIRRFDGAAKQYAKVLKATQGTKKCGYTVTARRPKKRCA